MGNHSKCKQLMEIINWWELLDLIAVRKRYGLDTGLEVLKADSVKSYKKLYDVLLFGQKLQ